MDINITFSPNRAKRLAKKKLILTEQYRLEGKDLANIIITKKWMKNFSNSFTLSVFNVYNRYNPYFIYLTRSGDFTRGNLVVGAKQVTLFPIIPSLTWNFRF